MGCWVELARAFTPKGDEVTLRQSGDDFEIRFNGWEVMSNRSSISEEALARLVCEDLGQRLSRILIGGLGMGYTARAALDAATPDAAVIVSELVPAIVDWNRGVLANLACRPLEDSRIEVHIGSIVDILSSARDTFDAILLDVDNGPSAVLYEPNKFLYSACGLEMAKKALAVDGVLGVWSADRSLSFEDALDAAGMTWRSVNVAPTVGDSGAEHTIYLAHV